MGSFANSLHVKSENCAAVAEAIRALLLAEGYEPTDAEPPRHDVSPSLRALHVSRPRQGWVSALDSEMMSCAALAPALSERLNSDVLTVWVNDSDSWHYQLCRAGQMIDEFASAGGEDDEDDEEWEAAAGSMGQVNASDAQRIIMERAQQWQQQMEQRVPPHLRELQEKWKKTGRVNPEEMLQYQQEMRSIMAPLMGDIRSMLSEVSSAARAAAPGARPADNNKLRAHVEHLKPLLQNHVGDERVLAVLGKQVTFAEETLAEFLPLLGIASFYAQLSYMYLDEYTEANFANESIHWADVLKFKRATVPGAGRRRVVH